MGRNPKQKATGAKLKPADQHIAVIPLRVLPFFILCLSLFLICTFVGCESETKSEPVLMSAEEKKTVVLEQLNRKFENPDAHFELGQLYQAEGNWTKAEYHYNVALGFDPAHRPAQAAIVKGLIRNGDKAKADQYAKAYINQVSSSATASLQLAEAFENNDLEGYAFDCYQQALRLKPNSPKVNKQVGYYYLKNEDEEKAKEYLSRSFQFNPNQADVAGELGRLGVVVRIP
jgi:uncharacterized protein HemY